MAVKGRKPRSEPWRAVLQEFIEDPGRSNGTPKRAARLNSLDDTLESARAGHAPADGVDKVVDIDDRGRKYEVEQPPLPMGDDGDDNPKYAQPKVKVDSEKLDRGDINDPVQVKLDPADNLPGQMIEAGHGFIVNDPRSRPWKTARRTHCAHCGKPLPRPDVRTYACELDPEASELELLLIGREGNPGDRDDRPPHGTGDRLHSGCQCSGCCLRWLVKTGRERGVGQPRKYCSKDCTRWADNERKAWKRAVASAKKRGDEPPPAPEDKGLKFRLARGLRSSAEGTGHRYVASRGLPWGAPRA